MCCRPSHGIRVHPSIGPGTQHEHCPRVTTTCATVQSNPPCPTANSSDPAVAVVKEGGCYGGGGHHCCERAADGSEHGHCQMFVVAWMWHFQFQSIPSL